MAFSRRKPRPRSERWEREDAAQRLCELVPRLSGLKLELREVRENLTAAGSASIRHVVIATAAARFEFKCSGCQDGNYDVTRLILGGLERGLARFEGTCTCFGSAGSQPCERSLTFVAHATYTER
jgi:hypothetical protein